MKGQMIKPLTDHIVVQRHETPEKTDGGIFLPETQRNKLGRGEVLAVGSGKVFSSGRVVPLDVEVGDVVLFPEYAGTEISWGESRESVLLLREGDVHGVLT